MLSKEVFKTVSRIELSVKGKLDAVMTGAYHSSFKGNGMEFSEVREYVPGDDVRSIDWNVTARTGTPYVKKFVEERELSMLLMVDASSSSEFGSGSQMKGEAMAALTALLAFAAIKNNDKVGLLIFTDQVELFIPPAKGRKHVLRLVREILYFKPEHHGTNLQAALEYAGKILSRRSVVVVMSDFLDSGFDNAFKVLRKRHDVLAVAVNDVRETELPPVGLVELEDPETGETLLVDTGDPYFRESFMREAKRNAREVAERFARMSVDFVRILVKENFQDTAAPLIEHFRRRAREAR
ncbi:MAG: DUF58 domain-containing protein [Fibrobacteraceae bacterium]|jgi:uncharacterized protein (DUF58 family)|nr:DUF58 domain-containing protein [Fibrobacteraceae bacterium]MBQ5610164.1 DUF58 domain-containing protein [Fibrobacteraceae bacterium]